METIYQHRQTFYVDAIRTIQSSTVCSGDSITIFDYEEHLPDLDKESQQATDIERFRCFSQDNLGFNEKNLVTDVRYSMLPNQIKPMWGLVIYEMREKNEYVLWWTGRNPDRYQTDLFIKMVTGKECLSTLR
tara:strand:+ start:27 stop:422 length:396 start_codon:yes stop_codon:yes gene_type:complete